MQNFKAVTYDRHGPPSEVLQVREMSVAAPQPGQVLIRMRTAPINPVDLNVIEGKYPVRPPLPAVGGVEGVGEIAAVGAEVADWRIGDRVLVPHEFGSWRERGVASAAGLIAVPSGLSIEQAAMLKINPPTAWRMLHDFVELKSGDWILQNAGNSAVGRAVIQIARACGWRTVNVVRRAELVEELLGEGGDVVLLDEENLPKQVAEATGRAEIRLAFNAVGGDSAVRLANALAPGGTLVTYGAMGRQPLKIPNGLLIFKDLRWRGFWITEWYRTATQESVKTMFNELLPLVANGLLHAKVEKSYAIADALAGVEHAQRSRRSGKILLTFE
ncbi:MAG: hypothetical protein QOD99_1087 [Chthoniobacter sp.]|jgi:trans-2-enoyl-CoA reductase|nr:hypothetical protein [Chthoniobacter sp.]